MLPTPTTPTLGLFPVGTHTFPPPSIIHRSPSVTVKTSKTWLRAFSMEHTVRTARTWTRSSTCGTLCAARRVSARRRPPNQRGGAAPRVEGGVGCDPDVHDQQVVRELLPATGEVSRTQGTPYHLTKPIVPDTLARAWRAGGERRWRQSRRTAAAKTSAFLNEIGGYFQSYKTVKIARNGAVFGCGTMSWLPLWLAPAKNAP